MSSSLDNTPLLGATPPAAPSQKPRLLKAAAVVAAVLAVSAVVSLSSSLSSSGIALDLADLSEAAELEETFSTVTGWSESKNVTCDDATFAFCKSSNKNLFVLPSVLAA